MPDTHTRTQHTPGPWHVNPGGKGDGRYYIDVDRRDERLNPTIGAFRELGDAVIAAAALDQHAALEACTPLLVLALHYAEQRGDAEYQQRLRAAIDANNAAIRKARGEESIETERPDTDDGLTCEFCSARDGAHFRDCQEL